MNGTIKTRIRYVPEGGSGEVESPVNAAEAGPQGTASGEADGSGAGASAENPNSDGGSDEVEERWDIPEAGRFTKAIIELALDCGGGTTKSLKCEGNVSVSGKISGGCITCVEVNSSTDAEGKKRTKRKSKKKCCEEG